MPRRAYIFISDYAADGVSTHRSELVDYRANVDVGIAGNLCVKGNKGRAHGDYPRHRAYLP